jgi:hypothetical protein
MFRMPRASNYAMFISKPCDSWQNQVNEHECDRRFAFSKSLDIGLPLVLGLRPSPDNQSCHRMGQRSGSHAHHRSHSHGACTASRETLEVLGHCDLLGQSDAPSRSFKAKQRSCSLIVCDSYSCHQSLDDRSYPLSRISCAARSHHHSLKLEIQNAKRATNERCIASFWWLFSNDSRRFPALA